MSIQRDYILRQIEMLGVFFQQVMKMLSGDEIPQTVEAIEQMSLKHTGQKFDHLLFFQPDDLLRLFGADGRGRGYAFSAVELLTARALVYDKDLDTDNADQCRSAALRLAVRLEPDDEPEILHTQFQRIRDLQDHLSDDALEPSLPELMRWYVAAGKYDQAENLLDFSQDAAQSEEMARELYARLSALSDDALNAGGLTREEVNAAMSERGVSIESLPRD